MIDNEVPNQSNGYSERHTDYLKRAADACRQGDTVLGMHLYLAAYEKASADPDIPDGTALTGLREAWNLACELKERSMAEYVFEKLEPYLTGEEIAVCAGKLQSLALDRLEEYGFSREDLEDMAEMISQDFIGGDAPVVKVESISIPATGSLGVAPQGSMYHTGSAPSNDPAGQGDQAKPNETGASPVANEGGAPDADDASQATSPETGRGDRAKQGFRLADVNDFNPYDYYRDYSIGKSYHAATNEGSGAAVFTRDAERLAAHENYLESKAHEVEKQGEKAPVKDEAPVRDEAPDSAVDAQREEPQAAEEPNGLAVGQDASGAGNAIAAEADISTVPQVGQVGQASLNYRSLVGYDDVVATVRSLGLGLHNDRGFQSLVAMLNERHGLDRAPAMDALLFRAPVLEDASRFVEATIGELGLPVLRMSMEEGVQGMPVLCVTTQGSYRPRMNHAHNRFEAPAILVLDELDMWSMPQVPEGVEGMAGFVMANISRGAREAMNLIRSAVEDPDVYVLATAAVTGEIDPFFYDVLEPFTVVDIDNPNDKERVDIWAEIARDHPSMRMISRPELMRFSRGMARYDMYIAARDAIEEAYKLGIVKRSYVPVEPANIYEKLAACQPLESEEYHALENEIVNSFKRDLDQLDDLVDGSWR